MVIVILFYAIGYINLKIFYNGYVLQALKRQIPNYPSYNRFLELKKSITFPLHCYLTTRFSTCTGISFIDPAPLRVRHERRIHHHRVCKEIVKRGKSSTGWFYEFKLILQFSWDIHICFYLIIALFTQSNSILFELKKTNDHDYIHKN
ncbi:MAG: transposase [Chlamydia sp.]